MEDLKIDIVPWEDFNGGDTEAMFINVGRTYTVSELIKLLEAARERWGDKMVVVQECGHSVIGGFSKVYLHRGYDYRDEFGEDCYGDDMICIYW